MSAVLTLETLRNDIATREALIDLMRAEEDVSEVDCDVPMHITITKGSAKTPVSFAHAIPRDVLLVGLRVMRAAMEQMVKQEAEL
jgi:hypothetical protein